MKILAIGGGGYLGGALVDLLVKNGDNVHVYDSLLYERQYFKPVPFHYGDVRDKHRLLRLIDGEDYDAIVWLAAIVGDPACSYNEDIAREVNQDAVEWLSSIAGDRRICFPSSCSVYGSNMKRGLVEEDDARPLSIYAETKLNAEKFLLNKNAVIFRLGTLFGLGDKFARPRFDLVVNVMTANMVEAGKLTVFGGDQMRPLVHVQDVARAIRCAIYNNRCGIYNLTNYNMRIDELAQKIRDVLGYGTIENSEREGDGMDARDYSVSCEKFIRDFQMEFHYPLERAIAEIAYAIEHKRVKNFRSKVFNNLLNIKDNLSNG